MTPAPQIIFVPIVFPLIMGNGWLKSGGKQLKLPRNKHLPRYLPPAQTPAFLRRDSDRKAMHDRIHRLLRDTKNQRENLKQVHQ
jgi:hypothetical protein